MTRKVAQLYIPDSRAAARWTRLSLYHKHTTMHQQQCVCVCLSVCLCVCLSKSLVVTRSIPKSTLVLTVVVVRVNVEPLYELQNLNSNYYVSKCTTVTTSPASKQVLSTYLTVFGVSRFTTSIRIQSWSWFNYERNNKLRNLITHAQSSWWRQEHSAVVAVVVWVLVDLIDVVVDI